MFILRNEYRGVCLEFAEERLKMCKVRCSFNGYWKNASQRNTIRWMYSTLRAIPQYIRENVWDIRIEFLSHVRSWVSLKAHLLPPSSEARIFIHETQYALVRGYQIRNEFWKLLIVFRNMNCLYVMILAMTDATDKYAVLLIELPIYLSTGNGYSCKIFNYFVDWLYLAFKSQTPLIIMLCFFRNNKKKKNIIQSTLDSLIWTSKLHLLRGQRARIPRTCSKY